MQTLDFFTPIVDDPYSFGQIAAANSLSDIYAMGGEPMTAMNIVAVPTDLVSLDDINLMLKGGADKVAEAGAVLAGGHTVMNPEPLYGLSVTGKVHPHRVIANQNAEAGHHLLLTKPLGTGIVGTAIKRGLASDALAQLSAKIMATLNIAGLTLARTGLTKAGTDITGFGLLGHLAHLCRESNLSARLEASAIPALSPEVIKLIKDGCVPGGTKKNLETASAYTHFGPEVTEAQKLLLADAQTSGGLLLAVCQSDLRQAREALNALKVPVIAEIGFLSERDEHAIYVS